MVLNVYSIFDSKAEYFCPPFIHQRDVEAVRFFMSLAVDSKSTISKFASDFMLYKIGSFDDSTGKFKNLDVIDLITNGLAAKNMEVS